MTAIMSFSLLQDCSCRTRVSGEWLHNQGVVSEVFVIQRLKCVAKSVRDQDRCPLSGV